MKIMVYGYMRKQISSYAPEACCRENLHFIYLLEGQRAPDHNTWNAGRQLKQMSKSGTTVQFKYDQNGLRVGKVVNGTETKYVLHGKLVAHMTCGSDNLHFFYDAHSKPAKVNFNGTVYTYLHNLQGDVVGILDNAGNLVVEYKYDAWGKLLSTTGSLAGTLGKRNPFRYRGYVFDEETGLYWLKNRYYSLELHRFINADTALGSTGMLLANNAFVYCWNNPVNAADTEGTWPSWITAVAAVATAVVATVVVAAAVPAAVCAASFTLAYYGVSMATATTVATVGVAAAGTFAVSGYYSDAIEAVTGTNPVRDVALSGSVQAYEDYKILTGFATAGIFQTAAYSPGLCFVAGTLISTKHGQKPIEEIVPDQLVWAEDPETGECELKHVVRTFINETNELVHICTNGESISCTPEHPFYVQGKGWIPAKELKLNDKLKLLRGAYSYVEAIQFEHLSKAIKVYNFEVEDFHTYFVGQTCILVHNSCKEYETRRQAFRAAKRENGIPMSAGVSVGPNYNKHNIIMPGRQYVLRVAPNAYKIIREDSMGHRFSDGTYILHHFNDEAGNHYIWKKG